MAQLPARRYERGVARWEPLRELEEMRERMDRLFDDLLRTGPSPAGPWSPLVDVEEGDDAWVVEAELPGVKRGDVTVELRDAELSIRGEVKEKERTGILRRRTRRTGEFDYRVTLPGEVDADNIDASLKEGVLTVRIPKPARAQPRRIEVKSG